MGVSDVRGPCVSIISSLIQNNHYFSTFGEPVYVCVVVPCLAVRLVLVVGRWLVVPEPPPAPHAHPYNTHATHSNKSQDTPISTK